MAIHDGHRQRLFEQLEAGGIDSFSEVGLLELLLTYAIPRRDTNPLAHALLDRFGTLANVLDATPAELEQTEGIGPRAAALLSMLPELLGRYEQSRNAGRKEIRTTAEAASYLIPKFRGAVAEKIYLLCLDARCRVLHCCCISDGSTTGSELRIRKIAEAALQFHAASVILAHNHPAGSPEPSREDLDATDAVLRALKPLDIRLADHLIIYGSDYTSLLERGLME